MPNHLRSTTIRPAALAALLIALLLIVAVCAAPGLPANPATAPTSPASGSELADTTGDVRSKGSADAAVTIVEYSDYQCPFWLRWVDETYPVILQEYIDTGKVRLEFRDFPLESLHPNAMARGRGSPLRRRARRLLGHARPALRQPEPVVGRGRSQ